MHSTLSLANRVSTWRKSLLRPSRFISSCCHTPLPRSSPGCAGHRSVDPHGGGKAQQTPRPLAHQQDTYQQPPTHHRRKAKSTGYLCEGSPSLISSQRSLVPHTLALSHTPQLPCKLTLSHSLTHTRKFPRHSHMLTHSYCHTHSHSHSHVRAHTHPSGSAAQCWTPEFLPDNSAAHC